MWQMPSAHFTETPIGVYDADRCLLERPILLVLINSDVILSDQHNQFCPQLFQSILENRRAARCPCRWCNCGVTPWNNAGSWKESGLERPARYARKSLRWWTELSCRCLKELVGGRPGGGVDLSWALLEPDDEKELVKLIVKVQPSVGPGDISPVTEENPPEIFSTN